MVLECRRPLCSATVFACNTAAALLDTYTRLVPVKTEYSPSEFTKLDLDDEARIITDLYKHSKYEYIVVGAPSGGAAQLAILFNAPLLPCNILTPVKRDRKSHPDDIDSYLSEALELALLLERKIGSKADILIHYDPVHDRNWVTHSLTIRIHFKKLPRVYKEFIKNKLVSNGTIIYVDVRHPWIQYKFTENIYVQVGGADDLCDWEYVNESDKIKKYIDVFNIEKYPWTTDLLDEAEKTKMPESEWGSREQFLEDVKNFAEENDYRLEVITLDNFYHTMFLGTSAYLALIREYNGVVVENYKQSSSTLFIKKKYLPLWSVFTTRKSLYFIDKLLGKIVDGNRVGELVYVSVPYGYKEQGTKWPDALSINDWLNVFNKYAEYTILIPREIKPYQSTRTLDVMNKIYEEAWSLGRGKPYSKGNVNSKVILGVKKFLEEFVHYIG